MMDSETRLVCAEQLAELARLLRALPPGGYSSTDDAVLATSIGAHVRHVLDHYDCLLHGLDRAEIDYACRSRDTRCESDVRFAAERIDDLVTDLTALRVPVSQTLAVRHEPGDPMLPANASTLGRELEFLHSHTAHHFALIAILLLRQGLQVPPDFGLARSTVRHRDSNREAESARGTGR
ncbi:MAG: hypothetical protein AAFX44_12640 [Pseudomonadota bacterium]